MNVALFNVSFLMLLRQDLRGSIDPGKEENTLFQRMRMLLVFVPFETPVVDLGSGGTPLNGPICFLVLLNLRLSLRKTTFNIHLGAKNPYEVKRRNTF